MGYGTVILFCGGKKLPKEAPKSFPFEAKIAKIANRLMLSRFLAVFTQIGGLVFRNTPTQINSGVPQCGDNGLLLLNDMTNNEFLNSFQVKV